MTVPCLRHKTTGRTFLSLRSRSEGHTKSTASSAPCPDYVPTKHELDLLARHWAGVKVEIEDFWQIHEQVGSSDMRQNAYANLRLRRIAKHLGDARIHELIEEAWKKFPPVAKADDHDTSEDHLVPDVKNTYEA